MFITRRHTGETLILLGCKLIFAIPFHSLWDFFRATRGRALFLPSLVGRDYFHAGMVHGSWARTWLFPAQENMASLWPSSPSPRRPQSRKPGRQQAAHRPPLAAAPPPPPLAALLSPRLQPLLGAAPPPPPTFSLFLRPHALAAVSPARSLVNEPQIWCGDQRAKQARSKGAKGASGEREVGSGRRQQLAGRRRSRHTSPAVARQQVG